MTHRHVVKYFGQLHIAGVALSKAFCSAWCWHTAPTTPFPSCSHPTNRSLLLTQQLTMADDIELIGGGDPLLPEPHRRCGLTVNEWVHIVAMVRRDIPRVLHLGPYRKCGITSDDWYTWSLGYLNGPVMSYILEIRKTYAKNNRNK